MPAPRKKPGLTLICNLKGAVRVPEGRNQLLESNQPAKKGALRISHNI